MSAPEGRAATDGAVPLPLPYPVVVDPGALDRLGALAEQFAPAYRYAVLADEHVLAAHGERLAAALAGLRTVRHAVPSGEVHKTRETWLRLSDLLLADGCGRDTTVIAVGGGVTGDVAGFVAATLHRGVPVVQVPTTLLAMVDASVGGKTGVDTPAGKNLVGAFHDPSLVVADPTVLATLAPVRRREGVAEMLKHGLLADEAHWAAVSEAAGALSGTEESGSEPSLARLAGLIAASVSIKAGVVAADRRESGRRQVLNAGHTIAHAIERVTGYGVPHGDAVAMGLVAEAHVAERVGAAAAGLAATVRRAVAGAGLPAGPPSGVGDGELLAATRSDKKVRGGAVQYALPVAIGAMAPGPAGRWSVPVADADVLAGLAAWRSASEAGASPGS